jgi:hypothetical protein
MNKKRVKIKIVQKFLKIVSMINLIIILNKSSLFIFLLLCWGYIVAFTEVQTICQICHI